MSSPEIAVFPDPAAVAREAADRIVSAAARAIAESGVFSIALSGGSTPKALFQLLAGDAYRGLIEWNAVHIYFGDERCVPPDYADSNFRMANETLLSKVPFPPENVHRIRGEIDPEEAAKEYGMLLKQKFGDRGLDVCLLGMGTDGHIASIFPGTPAVREKEHRVIAQFVEKSTTGKSWRVTMTPMFLNRSRQVLLLVAGKEKAARVTEVMEADPDPEQVPIKLLNPEATQITWLLDAAAAGMDEGEE